jgi:Cu(I)/Ag(I) efflux system membrane fusion protein
MLRQAAAERLKRLGLTEAQIAGLPAKDPNETHTQILAPVAGTVVTRMVYAGQYVKEGERLFELADFSTMWFQFDAYERDLAWIKPGQTVEVTTPAVPGQTFTGAVVFIDPNLKEMTRSAKVRVELANPLLENDRPARRQLYHRLYAEARVQIASPEVLTVSRTAVLAPGSQPLVYVEKAPGVYEQRRVRLGRSGDDAWEILDGLSAGERVVTTGNMLVDAQAQLNATGGAESGPAGPSLDTNLPPTSTGTQPGGTPAEDLPALSSPQRAALTEFLNLATGVTDALASDNLAQYNERAAQVHRLIPGLLNAFPDRTGWRLQVEVISTVGHLAGAGDLKSARKEFHPLSEASVALAKALRTRDPEFRTLRVYRCPMTKDSFPGAPRTAEWIQRTDPIRNPYFGQEMLDCGSEVK